MKKDPGPRFARRTLLSSSLAAASLLPFRRAARAGSSAGSSAGFAADACVLSTEQEVGPYYIAEELLRSAISEGRPGVPLDLALRVLDVQTCRPLAGSAVDLWHCDAGGIYSGFGDAPDDQRTFLRGIQLTDADGIARFRTIFPGCYPGRTNHIHFKVRMAGTLAGNTLRGGHTAHIGQVFFPEDVTIGLMQTGAYAAYPIHRTPQDEDGVFRDQNGRAAIAQLTPEAAGFGALLAVAVDPRGDADPA